MPTLIDSLIVELKLDESKFTKAQAAAVNRLRQFKEAAKREASEVEIATQRAADMFSRLRTEVLAVGGALIGGGSVISFFKALNDNSLALGFQSKIIGTSIDNLYQFGQAAAMGGGSAKGMTNFLFGLNADLNQFSVTLQSRAIPMLQQWGIQVFDSNKKVRDTTQILRELIGAVEDRNIDPGRAAAWLRMVGMDEDTINVVLQGRQAFEDLLATAKKLGGPLDENFKIAKEATKVWNEWATAIQGVGYQLTIFANEGLKKNKEELDKTLIDLFGNSDAAHDKGIPSKGSMVDNFLQWMFGDSYSTAGAGGGANFSDMFGGGNAGAMPSGLFALVATLKNRGARITSTTGGDHVAGSKHYSGLAVDFVPSGGEKAVPGAARALRSELAGMGINATVLDESKPSSDKWTAPHVHVQFANPEAAAAYASAMGSNPGVTGAAGSRLDKSVHINTLNINAPNGSPQAIAGAFKSATGSNVIQSNTGATN